MASSNVLASTDARRLSVGRLALSGALSLLALYALCWVGAALGIAVTHMFIALFTDFETGSFAALLEGGAWALLAGAVAGAVFAAIYNLVSFVETRPKRGN